MDTRSKIVDAGGCHGADRLAVATGYFDPLLAWHACELKRIREGAGALAVILLPLAGELLPLRARAELAAALRMVDYVLIAENGDLDGLFAELKPVQIVRLEDDDLRRRGELMEHVRCLAERTAHAREKPPERRLQPGLAAPHSDRPGGLSHIE